MTDPYLVQCLVKLRDEFNAVGPHRDKASDGWIGDADHSARESDHNPDDDGGVHAIDIDESGPWLNGATLEKMVQHLIAECRKSGESGLDRGRLKYVIYERRIWEASNGWAQRSYTGTNPHDKHAHFSCEYAHEYETDTRPWGVAETFGGDMSTPQDNAQATWDYPVTLPDGTKTTAYKILRWIQDGVAQTVAESEDRVLAALAASEERVLAALAASEERVLAAINDLKPPPAA